jgi:hypothetical protein
VVEDNDWYQWRGLMMLQAAFELNYCTVVVRLKSPSRRVRIRRFEEVEVLMHSQNSRIALGGLYRI